MNLTIELCCEDGIYKAYLSDEIGGSGIFVEGDTPETLTENLAPYIEDYADRCVVAKDTGRGLIQLYLGGGERVFVRECFNIENTSGTPFSVIITDETGDEIGVLENTKLPNIEDINNGLCGEFLEAVENIIG